jgi:hypothetical protein
VIAAAGTATVSGMAGGGPVTSGGATVSGMAGGGPATSGGARGARRSLTLGRLSRLEIETMECLRDHSGYQSKVTS